MTNPVTDSPRDYPQLVVPVGHVEPVPRRIRAMVGDRVILDTSRAIYLWEVPMYPQYYIPFEDVDPTVLIDEEHQQRLRNGTAQRYGLQVGGTSRPSTVRRYTDPTIDALRGMVKVDWAAVDAWFEEDEQVYVHPRSPYTRVDALRSSRTVRVELDGVVLAESSSPVLVFETGLPTRYYLNPLDVHFAHLEATGTVTECPYKGTTGGYWSVRTDRGVHPDLAWTYRFPTRQLLPITGLIAFYNEKVDTFLDGVELVRPSTHFG